MDDFDVVTVTRLHPLTPILRALRWRVRKIRFFQVLPFTCHLANDCQGRCSYFFDRDCDADAFSHRPSCMAGRSIHSRRSKRTDVCEKLFQPSCATNSSNSRLSLGGPCTKPPVFQPHLKYNTTEKKKKQKKQPAVLDPFSRNQDCLGIGQDWCLQSIMLTY